VKPHCDTRLSFEELTAYWADDLTPSELERIEAHLFGCESCTREAARVSSVVAALGKLLPPIIDHAKLAELGTSSLSIEENPVRIGERRPVVFRQGLDILIHRLTGLDLTLAERVAVTVSVEETGDVLFAMDRVPFDRDSGEILVACQRHFAVFPPNVVFQVQTHDRAGQTREARYAIPHLYGA
jgi:hypothetical protein